MKGIVAVDSVFGNTMRIGEVIAEELTKEGHEVEVVDLGRWVPRRAEADFAFVGSPTRNGRMTGRSKRYVKRLSKAHWASRPVVLFDTVLHLPENERHRARMIKWTENGAAPRLKALAEERGLTTYPTVLRIEVTGLKGPLAPGSLDRAREFVREFLATVGSGRSD
ncbi:MAG: flavodoxin domain-containing protein [Methanomassiliicoccus sp.]|nr:flavodoxin domain-containing protein [Methanomassiliicoccus sp.]